MNTKIAEFQIEFCDILHTHFFRQKKEEKQASVALIFDRKRANNRSIRSILGSKI